MSCSVIIKTHNSERFIEKVLHSIAKQTMAADEVVIVDSASKNSSYLDSYQNATTHIYTTQEDIGFCKGNNLGYSKILPSSKYVLFLNPDAFLTPKTLEQCHHFMEANPSVGALTGALFQYNINDNKPTGAYDSTGVFRKWYGYWYDRDQGKETSRSIYTKSEQVPAICGAFMYCRRQALEEVILGGSQVFDESFFMYKEDIDLSWRLQQKGWKLVFDPSITIHHCRGWQKRGQVPRKYRLLSARNEWILHKKMSSPCMVYSALKYLSVKWFDL